MHRVTYSRTVKLTVSIDVNDDVARLLAVSAAEIDRFLDNRQDVIFDAAQKAAGAVIEELLRGYAEEFTPGLSDAPPSPPPNDFLADSD
jgi:hypothetical protein